MISTILENLGRVVREDPRFCWGVVFDGQDVIAFDDLHKEQKIADMLDQSDFLGYVGVDETQEPCEWCLVVATTEEVSPSDPELRAQFRRLKAQFAPELVEQDDRFADFTQSIGAEN